MSVNFCKLSMQRRGILSIIGCSFTPPANRSFIVCGALFENAFRASFSIPVVMWTALSS